MFLRETRSGRLTLFYGGANPPIEERRVLRMVTYSDLIQFVIMLCAVATLTVIVTDKHKK